MDPTGAVAEYGWDAILGSAWTNTRETISGSALWVWNGAVYTWENWLSPPLEMIVELFNRAIAFVTAYARREPHIFFLISGITVSLAVYLYYRLFPSPSIPTPTPRAQVSSSAEIPASSTSSLSGPVEPEPSTTSPATQTAVATELLPQILRGPMEVPMAPLPQRADRPETHSFMPPRPRQRQLAPTLRPGEFAAALAARSTATTVAT